METPTKSLTSRKQKMNKKKKKRTKLTMPALTIFEPCLDRNLLGSKTSSRMLPKSFLLLLRPRVRRRLTSIRRAGR